MALKKPSEFFKVNKISSINEEVEKISKDLQDDNLEEKISASFSNIDGVFSDIQRQLQESSDNKIKVVKDEIVKLYKVVDNIVENDIPKYKKHLSTTELRVESRIKNLKDELCEHLDCQVKSTRNKIEELYKETLDEELFSARKFVKDIYRSEIQIAVEKYVSTYSEDIVSLREELLSEIKKRPKTLVHIETKLEELSKKYRVLSENLNNIETNDPLLNTNPITLEQLKTHYQILVGRLQEQLASLGGGGEVRLEFLDDVDRNSAKVNGKFLKYDSSVGKWIGADASGGVSDIVDDLTPQLGGDLDLNGSDITGTGNINITGDARIAGILTVGTGSVTINGNDDSITIGNNLTITSSGNAEYSGVVTATSFSGDGSNLTGVITSLNGYATEAYVDLAVAGVNTFTGAATSITATQIVNWDTAYSWGDHSIAGYVTSISLVGYATEGYVDNAVSGVSTFSGDYADLTNKPTIPSDTGDLTNNVGFITAGSLVGYATETFVNNAVANLVDSAPSTLDTLNELASALGDDPNFATTITTSLGNKANLSGASFSGVVTATSFVGDGSNLTGLSTFSGDYADLTNKPTIPSDTGDLTNNVGFITAGSLVGYATEGYVDNAVVGFVTSGIVVGYATEGYVDNAVSGVSTFSGDYNDLTNKPSLGDLSDVSSSTPSAGQVLKWSGSEWQPAADLTAAGGSGIGLTDLSVVVNSAGINSLSYSNITGVFEFTPTSLVGYATEGYVDNAVVGFVTSGIVVGYATEGYVDNAVSGVSTFSGDYADLTNKPTIPSDTGDLTNSVGFITAGSLVGYATEGYVDNAVVGFVTSGIVVGYATEGYVDNAVVGFVTSGIVDGYATEVYVNNALVGYATETFVNNAVANLVDSAPGTLDTLNELAAALGDDPNFATTITTSLGNKANLSGASFTGITTISQLNVTGISTLGVTTVTDLTAQQINVSGIVTATRFESSSTGTPTIDSPNNININAVNVAISTDLTVGRNLYTSDFNATGNAEVSGIVTATTFAGSLTGNSTTATSLQTARTFEITGDVVGHAVSFDGTGNVSIAATIQPDSVTLGQDTTGIYVASISGTSGEIEVSGSGNEQSSVTIGLPDYVTVTGINASGIVTATTFTGDVIGNATSATVLQTSRNIGGVLFNGSSDIDLPGVNLPGNQPINTSGVITATTFSGSGASLTSIPNGALNNSSVSYGGVSLALGGTDATPAFDLSDATNYPYTSLTGITTEIVGDTTPQLGGTLDLNGNDITGTGDIDITGNVNSSGIITATTFESTQTTGTSPFTVASTTLVSNLNSDLLDGQEGSHYLDYTNFTNKPTIGDGTLTLEVSGVGLSGSQSFTANQTGNATFTVTSNATDSNTADTVVSRNSSGDFSANSITLAGQLNGPAEFIIDPAAVGDNTGAVRIKGDLYVDGTTTQINSTTLEIADFVVGIASTATTDLLADGAGIQIGPDNTLLYDHSNTALKSSENFNIASGKTYKIDGSDVLSSTTLGSGVTFSSLTTVGILQNLDVSGVTTASSFVKSGGTSTQFLKADGSVDSSTYLTSYTETDPVVAAISGIVKSNGQTISAAIAGTDYLTDISQDTTPQLGGTLDLNSNDITGTGNINITGILTATSFVKSGGTSTQFLKADGTVDSNTYLTSYTETNDLTSAVTWTNVPDANITQSSVTQHQAALSITESQISDLQSYLTSYTETNDLTSAVTWTNVPDANITQSSVTQHQAALSITESQISDLGSYLTSYTETNDLTSAVTWANVPDANITQSSVTQHQAALSITESQISDLGSYLTQYTETDTLESVTYRGNATTNGISVGVATATSFVKSGGTSTQFLKADGSVDSSTYLTSALIDVVDDTTPQLGGTLDLNGNDITGTGDIDITGNVNSSGVATATSFSGSGSSLTGLTGASSGTYGNATNSAQITVDANGRITGITNVLISGGGGGSGGLAEIVEDTTPQLGGTLDLNGNDITGTGDIDYTGNLNLSGVATATSFVKSGGTSTQFLKADGSVDTNTYLTSYTETQTLDDVTSLGNSTSNGISVGVATATSFVKSGGTSTQFLKADGSVDTNTYLTSYTETDPVVGAVNGIVKADGAGNISAATAGTDYLTPSGDGSSLTNVDATTLDGIDSTSFLRSDVFDSMTSGGLSFSDNVKLYLGSSNQDDASLYHDGTDTRIENRTGDLVLETIDTGEGGAGADIVIKAGTGKTSVLATANGAVELWNNNSKKFETSGIGVTVTGQLDTTDLNVAGVSTFQGNVNLGDNDRLNFGDDGDLTIYHDGTYSVVADFAGGGLYLSASNSVIISDEMGIETLASFTKGGSAELYYADEKKLETSGIGVTVTGQLDTTDLNVAGVSTFVGVSTFQANLFVDGTINSTTAVNVNGVSVIQSAVDEALALAIALG